MRKISSINKQGKVLFEDDKGTGTTTGTKQECLEYGFKFRGNECFCYDKTAKVDYDGKVSKGNIAQPFGSFVTGIGNKITGGFNNIAIGFQNLISRNASGSIAIGTNAYTERYGELAYSSCNTSNKAKYSTLMYTGTTTNNTATELFLGGNQSARYFVNESNESAMYIEARCVCLDVVNNDAVLRSKILLYKYAGSTLTEIFDTDYVNSGDSSLSAVALAFAPIASTPDYIEVKVTGLSSTRLEWNIVLTVTEVKNA